jgi:phosphoribosylanthranilate isomerase
LIHVKICGITSLEDALMAVDCGADFLGFNFYQPSPRYIEPAHCARITATLRQRHRQVRLVGVFVNTPPEQIQSVLESCHLHLAQLHGSETPSMLASLAGRAYKALRTITLADLRGFIIHAPPAPRLLLDANVAGAFGGTGQTGDWAAAAKLAIQFPILLAGGLTPENVAEAVAAVQPWGVDVASGVESSPGCKDPLKLKLFISAARREAA